MLGEMGGISGALVEAFNQREEVAQFHTYARSNGLTRFISTAYREVIRYEEPQEE
jgi:hypothetical protein